MAKVSGQLKDASINGKPRDLMNMIFDISPTDTPFLTACGKSSASQTLHEWQTDILNAPVKMHSWKVTTPKISRQAILLS